MSVYNRNEWDDKPHPGLVMRGSLCVCRHTVSFHDESTPELLKKPGACMWKSDLPKNMGGIDCSCQEFVNVRTQGANDNGAAN